MSETQKLKRIIAVLLHRLGGHCMIVRADYQATANKAPAITGRLGNMVTLELVDLEPMPDEDDLRARGG